MLQFRRCLLAGSALFVFALMPSESGYAAAPAIESVTGFAPVTIAAPAHTETEKSLQSGNSAQTGKADSGVSRSDSTVQSISATTMESRESANAVSSLTAAKIDSWWSAAKAIGATAIAISQICRRRRSVSAEMALKLGRLFNVSPELWMGIQADYDLEVARLESQERIEKTVRPLPGLQRAAA